LTREQKLRGIRDDLDAIRELLFGIGEVSHALRLLGDLSENDFDAVELPAVFQLISHVAGGAVTDLGAAQIRLAELSDSPEGDRCSE
jgi:hypothetical protein